MPPKERGREKAVPERVVRPSVSDSSLFYVPTDAVEGFQERIETDIDWVLVEEASRHHKKLCSRTDIPPLPFSEALENKINASILHGFLDEHSALSLDEHWELLLPITLWDSEKCGNEEQKVCFQGANSITDDLIKLIKRAVRAGDRNVLKEDLKMVHVLRVIGAKMSEMDEGLKEYQHLVTLNLCGNFIAAIDPSLLPPTLKILELQANAIRKTESIQISRLPPHLLYLGLARNLLTNDGILDGDLKHLPHHLKVLDLSYNDIYDLIPVLALLRKLPNLSSLSLIGNPCSVCAAYARTVISMLPRLRWLDSRQILPVDRPDVNYEPHPVDLRSSYFNFSVLRIMSAPIPPKAEKGTTQTFHVELELPLLDVERRRFLMYRNNEFLTEMLPLPEDDEWEASKEQSVNVDSKVNVEGEGSSQTTDPFANLVAKNSREIRHYTTFESNKVPWNKLMTFQEPAIRIFCPDLTALRNTFMSVITIRLVYSQIIVTKAKVTKSMIGMKQPPAEQSVVLATIKCGLRCPDWSQPTQHLHWDSTLETQDAIHWGEGDLSVLQYTQTAVKVVKGKTDGDPNVTKMTIPENLTCHFSFGIDTLKL